MGGTVDATVRQHPATMCDATPDAGTGCLWLSGFGEDMSISAIRSRVCARCGEIVVKIDDLKPLASLLADLASLI